MSKTYLYMAWPKLITIYLLHTPLSLLLSGLLTCLLDHYSNFTLPRLHYLFSFIPSSLFFGLHKCSSGIEHLIPAHWLSFFNPHELQFLISGKRGPLDIEELRRNTIYSNGYHEDHVVILIFWHVSIRARRSQRTSPTIPNALLGSGKL